MEERILLVDDEEMNLQLLEALLTSEGYEVTCASDGPQALDAVKAHPPDLILLDLMMPGMSGLEVCQHLKDDSATAAIPVIVVTAMGQIATKEAALTGGADDFIGKPVRADDLLARVGAMLKVRRIRTELDRTLAYVHELEAARHAHRRDTLTALGEGEMPREAMKRPLVGEAILSWVTSRKSFTESMDTMGEPARAYWCATRPKPALESEKAGQKMGTSFLKASSTRLSFFFAFPTSQRPISRMNSLEE